MTTNIKYYILSIMIVLFSFSCKKKEDKAILNTSSVVVPTFSLINISGKDSTLVLDIDSANKNLLQFITNTKYIVQNNIINPSLNYEFAQSGVSFVPDANTVAIESDSIVLTNSRLNMIAIKAGLQPNVPGILLVRIKANISKTNQNFYSETKQILLVPHATKKEYNKMYMPGDYQNPNWKPGNADCQFLEERAPGIFSATVEKTKADGSLSNGEFKFTSNPDWDHTNYGKDASDPNKIDPAGNDNLKLDDGTYLISVDKANLTWTSELSNWGLVGNATNNADADGDGTPDGWQSDKNMRYNQNSGMYEITIDLEDYKFKFRKNDGWNTNFGDDGNNFSLDPGGADIPVPAGAGKYLIKLDVENKTYTITKL
jgi:starch-binding outer membrane protein SusE/F